MFFVRCLLIGSLLCGAVQSPVCYAEFDSSLPHLKEISGKLGATYLWCRIGEIGLRALGYIHGGQEGKDISTAGASLGSVANLFQGGQGVWDLWMIHQYLEKFENTDKRTFAYVAIARGLLNLASSTTYIAYEQTDNIIVGAISFAFVSPGTLLAFVKNIRDVGEKDGLEKAAFILCTVSRFPFIFNSLMSTTGLIEHDHEIIDISNYIRISAWALFVSGALIRQHLYHFPYAADPQA